MTKFAGVILGVAALTLSMASMAFRQNAVTNTDAQGRSVTVTVPMFSTPEQEHSSAIDPETITIYSNLGTHYLSGRGWTESGPTSQNGLTYQAQAFTPKATHYLAQIDFAIGYFEGTNGVTIYLETDNAGVPSGKKLFSCTRANLPVEGTTDTEIKTCKVAKTKNIRLFKNKQYWLVPIVNSDELAAWNFNGTRDSGNGADTMDGVTWTGAVYKPNGAFDVLGR